MKLAHLVTGTLVLGLSALSAVGCGGADSAEPAPTAAAAEALAAVATSDPVVSCVADCQYVANVDLAGIPSAGRLDCCRACLDGLPYKHGRSPFDREPWVCTTETHEYLNCIGLYPPLGTVCAEEPPTTCPSGFHKVAPGALENGSWCTRVAKKPKGHMWYFVYNHCADGSDVYPPAKCADGKGGTPYCSSSGGTGGVSHIVPCSALKNPSVCCAPDPGSWFTLGAGVPQADPTIASVATEPAVDPTLADPTADDAASTCGCSDEEDLDPTLGDPAPVTAPVDPAAP